MLAIFSKIKEKIILFSLKVPKHPLIINSKLNFQKIYIDLVKNGSLRKSIKLFFI